MNPLFKGTSVLKGQRNVTIGYSSTLDVRNKIPANSILWGESTRAAVGLEKELGVRFAPPDCLLPGPTSGYVDGGG